MHHYWLLAGSVLGYVFQSEALRQVKVKLHSRKLPQATDSIHQFDINFWPVERGFAGNRFVFDTQLLQDLFQRVGCQLPLVFTADETRSEEHTSELQSRLHLV